MTSSGDASSDPQGLGASRRAPTWPRVAVVGVLLLVAFFVSRGCQNSQIKVTQEEAVATATEQVDFDPVNTQVRMLRQGLDRRPVWIVSLSIPLGGSDTTFRQLALVRIDATTGEIVEVKQQRGGKRARELEEQGTS